MANMIDYLVWRGDISLEASPWCSIDSLLIATLSYLGFHGNSDGWTLSEAMSGGMLEDMPGSASFPNRKRAFEWMATSNRFGSARMHHYIAVTDPEREMQFSAMCRTAAWPWPSAAPTTPLWAGRKTSIWPIR